MINASHSSPGLTSDTALIRNAATDPKPIREFIVGDTFECSEAIQKQICGKSGAAYLLCIVVNT